MARTSEELDLVAQFRRGDDSAFDRIVERHSAAVAALANRLLGWPGDVDDIVQEVFLSAFLGLRKFRGDCRLRTWLFIITVNKCRSLRFRRQWSLLRAVIAKPVAATNSGPAGDEATMDEETFARVRQAVQALPQKYREVTVLRYLQGLKTQEIGEMLGVTNNVIEVRLNRARARLKEQLGELFEEKR